MKYLNENLTYTRINMILAYRLNFKAQRFINFTH